jgi:micrococcal nuclease
MNKTVVGIIIITIIIFGIVVYYNFPENIGGFEENMFCSGTAGCFTGKVTAVIDGDTIEVEKIRIRLALASAPELDETGGNKAKEFTSSLCPLGSLAFVDEDDGQVEGSFGRVLAKLYCDNVMINSALLESGNGYIDTRFCSTSEFAGENWAKMYGC